MQKRVTTNPRADARKRLLSILLGLFYTGIILSIALLAGSFLYEAARSHAILSNQLPDLDRIAPAVIIAAADLPAEPQLESSVSVEIVEEIRQTLPENIAQERINILLLGTDERPDEYGPPRTDTMMLVTLDLRHRTAGMISLPRDLWVPIPGYDITTKINTAYVVGERRGYPGGGPQLAKDTVSSFIGRPVEYYVRVNFNGFVRVIDMIGGVDVHVATTIHDDLYPTEDYGVELFHLDAGPQHLDGATALKYVRTRHGDSDYGRANRQQQVIQAVLEKVLAANMIPTLVSKAPELTATMRDSFGTDIPLPVMISLANYIRQNDLQNVERLVLDNRYGQEGYSEDGAWILLPDRSRVRSALAQFFDASRALPQEAVSPLGVISAIGAGAADLTPNNAPVVDNRSTARLEVLNGTDAPGVAARIRDLLQASGWQVITIGDADRSDYRRTLIVNYNADESLVEQINLDLKLPPDLPTMSGLVISDKVDMRIIVGQDFLKNVLGVPIP
ncbi:MAG: LCP family protein [Caldilineaceae bacterium]|nr:LCP family protein [Caldilineaceae bacterium]